jgi:hypothetical protein
MTQHSVIEPTSPLQSRHDNQFIVAVRQAATTMDRPEYNGRLTKAMDLALSGSVRLHDSTGTVTSGGHTYDIRDTCSCEDGRRRSLYCKHFLAVQLLKRIHARLGRSVNGTGAQYPQGEGAGIPSQRPLWHGTRHHPVVSR